MSAETLRRAAALMRERAEAATPGPWTARPTSTTHSITGHGRNVVVTPQTRVSEPNTQHIASWHPAVALAVADWLDTEANHIESGYGQRGGQPLAVARLYLGEVPDA